MEEIREQQVTLNDYIRMLYRGRWIILISFIIVAAATVYFTFTTQPVFEASALVMVKEEGMGEQIFEMSSFMNRQTKMNNQVEILKSRTLSEDVINRLQTSPYADSLWILGTREEDRKFSLKKRIFSLIKFGNGDEEEPTETELFDGYVKSFQECMSAAPKRDTDMIELKVQAFSPFEAAFIANQWMFAYRDRDIEFSQGEVKEVKDFLNVKVNDVENELAASEKALKEYMEKEGVVELDEETRQKIEQLAGFETEYQSASTDMEANAQRLKYLRNQLDERQKAIMSGRLTSPQIEELEKQLGQLIGKKASYDEQIKATDDGAYYASSTASLKQQIEGLQNKINEEKRKLLNSESGSFDPVKESETLMTTIIELETTQKALEEKTKALGKIVKKFNNELDKLPEKSLNLVQLKREAEVNNNIYIMLRQKLEENRIIEAGQIGLVRIVDPAKPPKEPIKPKKKMNLLLGIMVGLGLGIGITFVREYMDTSLKTMEDIEREGFAVLGSIPYISPQKMNGHVKKGNNGDLERIESRIVTHFAPKSPISEAYRTLRTNTQYSKIDGPLKTALITSSGPGEGKSTSAANLAITFAQMGAKTLLVDADLRRPVIHGIFGMGRKLGLTNVLVGKGTLEEMVQPAQIDNLHILTSGMLPPNPSELLSSKAFDKFLEEAKSKYDIVLFDSPPVIAVTDAAVLAPKMDGVVLLAKSGATARDALLRARVLLENVNAKLFGVLLNGVNVDNMYGSYYYYYHYYYYGDHKNKKRRSFRKPKALV